MFKRTGFSDDGSNSSNSSNSLLNSTMKYTHKLEYLELKRAIGACLEAIEANEVQALTNKIALKAFEEEIKNHKPPELPKVENEATG